jgi:hypothetical protein
MQRIRGRGVPPLRNSEPCGRRRARVALGRNGHAIARPSPPVPFARWRSTAQGGEALLDFLRLYEYRTSTQNCSVQVDASEPNTSSRPQRPWAPPLATSRHRRRAYRVCMYWSTPVAGAAPYSSGPRSAWPGTRTPAGRRPSSTSHSTSRGTRHSSAAASIDITSLIVGSKEKPDTPVGRCIREVRHACGQASGRASPLRAATHPGARGGRRPRRLGGGTPAVRC